MPRARKTQSGDRAMPTSTGMPGVRYGEGVELQQLQQALPTPNARAGGVPSPQSPAAQSQLPAEAAGASLPAAMPTPGLLLAPTMRPTEPITHGLRHGPGGGPEVLAAAPMESPTGKFLRDLARVTGREKFAELARRSGL